MATGPGGKRPGGGRGGDDADFEEYFRRMCRGLRERARGMPRPRDLSEEEVEQRERVRLRALSLLGVMRPDLQDLDALGWGEALEKVCDAIIDLWICEDCHEEGARCTCLLDMWEHDDDGFEPGPPAPGFGGPFGFGEEDDDEDEDPPPFGNGRVFGSGH